MALNECTPWRSTIFRTCTCAVRNVDVKHMVMGAHMAIRTRWISNWENTADICKYVIISDLHMYNNTVHRLK